VGALIGPGIVPLGLEGGGRGRGDVGAGPGAGPVGLGLPPPPGTETPGIMLTTLIKADPVPYIGCAEIIADPTVAEAVNKPVEVIVPMPAGRTDHSTGRP
jgi:hypothetical protein